MNSTQLQKFIRLSLILPLLEGILFLVISLPSAGHLPRTQIFIAIPLFILALFTSLAFAWLAITAYQRPRLAEQWAVKAAAWLSREPLFTFLILITALVCAAGLYILFITMQIYRPVDKGPIIVLLFSFLGWFLLFAFQVLITLRILRYGLALKVPADFNEIRRAFIVIVAVFSLIALILFVTKIGLTRDPIDWGVPAVPLLTSQVLLAWIVTLVSFSLGKLFLFFWQRSNFQRNILSFTKADLLICLLLWLGAVWLWSAQPIRPSWFNPKPGPPNNEYYPYSDSIHYDLSAQRLLLGNRFEPNVIRPAYSGFLALAHAFNGNDYERVVNWQAAILAAMPALLYLLTKTLHHRLSGLLVGLLAIMHENNSIALTGITDVSNSKMYLSDLPTRLGVILVCLLFVLWLKSPQKHRLLPLLAGGALGIFMLVRTQIVVLFPFLPVLGWLAYRKQRRLWVEGSLLLTAGLVLSLLPWFLRNIFTTSSILSDPEPSGLWTRFTDFAPEATDKLSGETEEEYAKRMQATVFQNIQSQPLMAFKTIANHYVNNHIAPLFVLPTSFNWSETMIGKSFNRCSDLFCLPSEVDCCSVKNYVRSVPYWSGEWDMSFPIKLWLPLLFSLLFLSLGIAVSWNRTGLATAVLLFTPLVYNLPNAATRLSGWRFSLPVDWIPIVFFAIGWVEIFFWVAIQFTHRISPSLFENGVGSQPNEGSRGIVFPWRQGVITGMLLSLITTTLPLAERLIPDRFANSTVESTLASLEVKGLLAEAGLTHESIDLWLKEEAAVSYVGRVFYPRHYLADQGELSRRWPAYLKRDYPRLSFMVAPQNEQVMLPINKPPRNFPNAADALILGCKREGFIEASVVVVLTQPEEILLKSGFDQLSCGPSD